MVRRRNAKRRLRVAIDRPNHPDSLDRTDNPYLVAAHVQARLLGVPLLSLEARVVASHRGRRSFHEHAVPSVRDSGKLAELAPPPVATSPQLYEALDLWIHSEDLLHQLRQEMRDQESVLGGGLS